MSALFLGEAALYNSGTDGPATFQVGGNTLATCSCPYTASGIIKLRTPKATAFVPGENHFSSGCADLGFSVSDPIYFSYHSLYGKKGWVYWNYAFEDLDGDGDIGAYLEVIGARDGELYRAGNYVYGDRDTILAIAIESTTSPNIPNAP